MTKEEVLTIAHDKHVKFIKLWFTDILGFAKSFTITMDELEGAFAEGRIHHDGVVVGDAVVGQPIVADDGQLLMGLENLQEIRVEFDHVDSVA